ncbi:putative ankyrin repeat-containing domain-containing protein [Helianthus anomalus]
MRQQRLQLYRASITGDREAARRILGPNRDLVRWELNENEETPLHVAVASHSTVFVRYLVNMMHPDELELRNKDGNTAFCLAAIAGNVEMARIMVGRHGQLPTILGRDYKTPLYLAAFHGKHDMVTYLYGLYIQNRGMPGPAIWTDDRIDEILLKCMEAGIFDVGRQILDDHAQLPQDNNLWDVLQILARKPNVFHVKNILPNIVEISLSYGIWSFYVLLYQLMRGVLALIGNLVMGRRAFEESNAALTLNRLLERLMDNSKNTIDNILKGPMSQMGTYPSHVLFIAAKMNNSKFLVELIREYPDVIYMKNDDGHSIFHISVSHRHLNIYNLINEIGPMKDLITTMTDHQGNNILHLVGMNPEKNPYEDSLAAPKKLKSELFWYKVHVLYYKLYSHLFLKVQSRTRIFLVRVFEF